MDETIEVENAGNFWTELWRKSETVRVSDIEPEFKPGDRVCRDGDPTTTGVVAASLPHHIYVERDYTGLAEVWAIGETSKVSDPEPDPEFERVDRGSFDEDHYTLTEYQQTRLKLAVYNALPDNAAVGTVRAVYESVKSFIESEFLGK